MSIVVSETWKDVQSEAATSHWIKRKCTLGAPKEAVTSFSWEWASRRLLTDCSSAKAFHRTHRFGMIRAAQALEAANKIAGQRCAPCNAKRVKCLWRLTIDTIDMTLLCGTVSCSMIP